MNSNGLRPGERASALWGTGARGGDSRGSALWGKGGRRAGATLISAALAAVVLSFGASLPASAASGTGKASSGTFIHAALLSQAQADPAGSFDVIIQGDGSTDAEHLANKIGAWAAHADQKLTGDQITRDQVKNEFSSINGVAVTLTGRQLAQVYSHSSDGLLSITPDVQVQASGNGNGNGNLTKPTEFSNYQLWPYAAGDATNWDGDPALKLAGAAPTIAVVDSGIQPRTEFDKRILASVNLSSLPNNSSGDGRGHGTMVAGMAAASMKYLTGSSPIGNLVSIDVLDDSGMGMTSDIINACQWILDHKAQYNIRVANFSLTSSITAPFWVDPLDRAIEQLWFNGIVVVTAAGNYGSASGPSGVAYSPGDDPFVITVGATDLLGTLQTTDDTIAPWSAWGSTIDGFAKPEISAPGRYVVGPVPTTATLPLEHPENVVYPGYMQLSGTSFAAPVVAGAAADILARHPDWTPDQVKGALMLTAQPISAAAGTSGGVGEINAYAAGAVTNPPNPNLALDSFVTAAPDGSGGRVFDSASWNSAAMANASWNSVSWNSASWNSASWNSASWNSVSWNSASWNSVSWNSVSWNSVSWNSASWNNAANEQAAESETTRDPSALKLFPSNLFGK